MSRKRNSGRGFDRVVNNIARSLVKEIDYKGDDEYSRCRQHTGLDSVTIGGYKCVHFADFDDLDRVLSQDDPEWRSKEWAQYWLRSHWAFQTSEYEREEIHDRGVKFKQRTVGSVRHKRSLEGPKQLRFKVSPDVLATFISDLATRDINSLRDIVSSIKEEFNINLSYETIRRIKKKYNL